MECVSRRGDVQRITAVIGEIFNLLRNAQANVEFLQRKLRSGVLNNVGETQNEIITLWIYQPVLLNGEKQAGRNLEVIH